jgi:hypothetical protein
MRTTMRVASLLVTGLWGTSSCGGLGPARSSAGAGAGGQGGIVGAGGVAGVGAGGAAGWGGSSGAGGTIPATTTTAITVIAAGGAIGQTDFVSEEPNGGYTANTYPGDVTPPPLLIDGSSTTLIAAPPAPPSGRVAEVEEADIYRIDGNLLYYFNTYRGLLIFDIADPKTPKLLSRLSVFGYPVEMFVSGATVFALLRDALYLTTVDGKPVFERRNVSQLVAVDASDPAHPAVIKTVDIVGQLREGVSRKIENTLYVVSYMPQGYYYSGWYYARATAATPTEQAWVYSFDVSDPKNPKKVNELEIFEGGSVQFSNGNQSYYKYFQGVNISATANALMVAENWNVYGYTSSTARSSSCGSYESNQLSVVSIIDVSDPKGTIRRHTRFETSGQVGDQFKMTYVYDDAAKTGTFFGIFAREVWASAGCTGTSYTQNTLESWDVTDGANPVRVGRLDFGKQNEVVRGTAFDVTRKVVYGITAQSVDPLYAISIADPKALKILSAVDGLSGDMSVFRLIADRQFLIAVGTDTSSTCTGFDTGTGRQAAQIAVSIIDVRDLAKVRLVQRQCVSVQGAAWGTGSALTSNLDQAHKMIGMFSDAEANVITVPVYYYTKTANDDWWWYTYQTAVGIMAWDLTKYDDSKDETQQTVLTNYGSFLHPNGQVRRTIVYTHPTTGRRSMLNLSDTHASLADIQDLANPVQQSIVELAPYYAEIYRFGDYLLEHVQPQSSSSQEGHDFRVRSTQGGLGAVPVASFTLGQVSRTVKVGDNLVVLGYLTRKTDAGTTSERTALVYDLSDPTAPRRAAQVVLPSSVTLPYYYYYCGWAPWGGYWSDWSSASITTATSVVMLSTIWDSASSKYKTALVLLDLGDPAAPQLSTLDAFATDSASYNAFSLVPDALDPSGFYLASRTKVGEVTRDGYTFTQYRHQAQRWQLAAGQLQPAETINLPGPLVNTWAGPDGERRFLTRDYVYSRVTETSGTSTYSYYLADAKLELLRGVTVASGLAAELLDAMTTSGASLSALVREGNTLLINARPYFTSYSVANSVSWEQASDRLTIFDLSADRFAVAYDQPTNAYYMRIMGTQKGRAFLNLQAAGIVVVDIAKPAAPTPIRFLRTLGYATHLESFGDDIYVASGYFGLEHMSLVEPPSMLASATP